MHPSLRPSRHPFSFLDIRTGWLVFSLVQLLCVLAAVLVAMRSAEWPADLPRRARIAVALAGTVGVGTYVVLLQGQWSGLFALALALGHACWRRGWHAAGAMVTMIPLLSIKPNLALGFGAFMLGWANRRVFLGLTASVVTVDAGSLAVAGIVGVEGFVTSAVHSTQQRRGPA